MAQIIAEMKARPGARLQALAALQPAQMAHQELLVCQARQEKQSKGARLDRTQCGCKALTAPHKGLNW